MKQIEVASATIQDAHNKPYIRVVATNNRRGVITATVELDVETPSGKVRRKKVNVQDGDDLVQTTGRSIYRDYQIGEIRVKRGDKFVEIRMPGDQQFLRVGESWGDVDPDIVNRQMIRRTIREHLDKEKRLRPQRIKVLSLFFVDAVDRYRRYDNCGNPVKGDYALIFEEEYRRLAKHPDYITLFRDVDLVAPAGEVHNGYFSIDKKGGWTDTLENNQANRANAERAYNLIMKDKEKLLTLETPLKFIFSHSALREGWDNPNVFQICALRNIQTERERRQTIGRGLRLCVNQEGERLRGFDVNTLTVVARESYEEFAKNLQHEIEKDTGIRFGILEPHQFAAIMAVGKDEQQDTLGFTASQALFDHLQAKGYVAEDGRVRELLRTALRNQSLSLPDQFSACRDAIVSVLRKVTGRLDIKNANDRKSVRPRQAVLESEEFKALWNRIKHKTTYRVVFNNEELLNNCVKALRKEPAIPRARLLWHKADISIGRAGVTATETAGSAPVSITEDDIELPDVLTELQNRTQLTRRSIYRILIQCGRLADFQRNPQRFIELAAQTFNNCKRQAIVDGIKYERISGDESHYAQELFENKELTGYLKNMRDAKKSVYSKVICDSDTEERFADQLEKNTAVKVYAKLPGWFTVPTPLGSYNPDWAVLCDSDDGERLYFVVETKASASNSDLRVDENAKIECGKAHFDALRTERDSARYTVVTTVDELLASVEGG